MKGINLNMINSYLYKKLAILVLCIATIVFAGCKVSANSINANTDSGKGLYIIDGTIIKIY